MFPKLKNKIILAPMAGITDAAFRQLCRKYGAAMCFTEMISATALARNNKATIIKIDTADDEKPIGVQLFGQDAKTIVKSAEYIKDNKLADVIDFNLGCPATKIIRQGAGSALLKRTNRIKQIVESLCSVDIPITVKTRIGIRKSNANVLKVSEICEKAGVSAITVHARTQKQGYSGKAHWEFIKQVKDSVSIPVIGNGDITCPEDAERMLKETGCDYVMVGRAARGNPLLFKQFNDYFNKGEYTKTTQEEKIKAFFDYVKLAKKKNVLFPILKIQANYFTKGIFGGAELRRKISRTKNINQIINILEEQKI